MISARAWCSRRMPSKVTRSSQREEEQRAPSRPPARRNAPAGKRRTSRARSAAKARRARRRFELDRDPCCRAGPTRCRRRSRRRMPSRIHFSVRHSHTRSSDRPNCVNAARARTAAASTSSPTHTHSLSASTRSSAARAISRGRLLISARAQRPGRHRRERLVAARPEQVEADLPAAMRVGDDAASGRRPRGAWGR